jgi:uncharacterized membrane protein
MTDREGRGKLVGRSVFGLVFVVAGIAHFASPGPYIPWHREIVLLSGAIEILLGILLLIPRTSRLAAWGLVALLVAVFPANIHAYLHRDLFPPFPYSDTIHLLRLPFQAVLIYWAYSYTGKPRTSPPGAKPTGSIASGESSR